MHRAFTYRIYPNLAQRQALDGILDFCRFLYNCELEERISHYKKFGKSIGYVKQSAHLPEIKKLFPQETANIYGQVLQQALKRLNRAYEDFFFRIGKGDEAPGFPKFKGKDRFRSICFPQVQPDLGRGKVCPVVRLPNDKLRVFGLPGELKVKWHRPLQGRVKQVRIVKKGDQYYVSFACENVPAKPLPQTSKSVGIDLGLNNFITMDDGTTFHHPKPWKTAKEKITALNQKLARKQAGSKNRRRAKSELTRAYQKITHIRDDWQHITANQLITTYDEIILEDLNIKNMMSKEEKKKKQAAAKAAGQLYIEVKNENISDAAWGNFVAKLIYKAESAGRKVIQVDPKNTSKTCCNCGNIKETLALSEREYHCQVCGMVLDRDLNAAINIRGRGGLETSSILQRHGIGLAIPHGISEARPGSSNSQRDRADADDFPSHNGANACSGASLCGIIRH